jgi:hypothetical protein
MCGLGRSVFGSTSKIPFHGSVGRVRRGTHGVAAVGEIIFHAGFKLSWLEGIARDRGATDFDLKVGVALSNRTKADGVARYASQPWIARYIGASVHGVQQSLKRLSALGHLEPIRNELSGGRDGRPAFGGNGHATEYRLLKKKPPNSAGGSVARTPNGETTIGQAANPQPPSREPPVAVHPISYLSNKDSLAHPCAHARDGIAAKWLAVKGRLANELGRDVFESWFSKLTLVQLSDGVMILRPQSKFAARWLTDHYLDQALRAWRELEPSVASVRFDHTAIAAPEISSCTDVGSGEASR